MKLLLLVLACRGHLPATPPLPEGEQAPGFRTPPPIVEAPLRVVGDTWMEVESGIELPVPEGWVAWVGRGGDRVLAVFEHPATDVQVEVRRVGPAGAWPEPRASCAWTWRGRDPGGGPIPGRPARVASCTPIGEAAPLVLVWVVDHGGEALAFLAVIPPGALGPGYEAVRALLAGLELRPPLRGP